MGDARSWPRWPQLDESPTQDEGLIHVQGCDAAVFGPPLFGDQANRQIAQNLLPGVFSLKGGFKERLMDPTTWISSVTALASLVKAYMEAKKSGIELAKVRETVAPERPSSAMPAESSSANANTDQMIIDRELLETFEEDIKAAHSRFRKCVNDPRYTPADIDREQERARLTVCTHIAKIREFNRGELPTSALQSIEQSWCKDR